MLMLEGAHMMVLECGQTVHSALCCRSAFVPRRSAVLMLVPRESSGVPLESALTGRDFLLPARRRRLFL